MPFLSLINSIQIPKDDLITKCGRQIKIEKNDMYEHEKRQSHMVLVTDPVSDSNSHITATSFFFLLHWQSHDKL